MFARSLGDISLRCTDGWLSRRCVITAKLHTIVLRLPSCSAESAVLTGTLQMTLGNAQPAGLYGRHAEPLTLKGLVGGLKALHDYAFSVIAALMCCPPLGEENRSFPRASAHPPRPSSRCRLCTAFPAPHPPPLLIGTGRLPSLCVPATPFLFSARGTELVVSHCKLWFTSSPPSQASSLKGGNTS